MSLHDHPHSAAPCCDECEPAAPVRNHYFTGKLLVERDFTDEQHYFREKIRMHHQRLHGVGVVCGLEIKAHPNPACRDRMVVLQPGSAIDCCGHDILVVDEDILVLEDFPAWQALKELNDGKDHRLTFCLNYRECPTEEIPVLFDECGCDDTQCAPNRILESYAVDLRVDEPLPEKPYHSPKLEWNCTIGVAHAGFVALDEARNRAFALTAEANGTLYQIDLSNNSIVASGALGLKGLALAVSHDGKTVAVAARKASAPNDPITLAVFEPDAAGGIGAAPVRQGAVPDSAAGGAALAVTSGDGFVLLGEGNGLIATYAATIPDPLNPANRRKIGSARTGLVLDGTGKALVAQPGSGKIGAIDLAVAALPEAIATIPGIVIDAQVGVHDSAGQRLLVVDNAAKQVRLVDPVAGTLIGSSAALASGPVQLIASPDGNWVWIVLDDGTTASVAAIDVNRIRAGESPQAVGAAAIGRPAGPLALTSTGARLYAPFAGKLTVAAEGGVAVIGVSETDCWAVLKGGDCPGCVIPDCLILATVENYRPGFKLEDPPAIPASDHANGIARIDNVTWRTLLPSTQAIAQALLCLKDRPGVKGDKGDPGASIVGPQGPAGPSVAGPQGPAGESITGPQGPPGQSITGPQGPPGKDLTLDQTLVHVCMISWPHRGEVKQTEIDRDGLRIGFDGPIVFTDVVAQQTLQVQFQHDDEATGGKCWCDVPIKGIEGFDITPACDPRGSITTPAGPMVNGLHIIFSGLSRRLFGKQWFRVLLHGDLISDSTDPDKARSIDGNNLAPWLPLRKKSGDGIAGGTFESFFFVNFGRG